MDLKGLLADQMGAFTPYDIGGGVLAILLAALIAFVTGLIGRGSGDHAPKQLAVLAAVVALAVLFVRASVPLSIALAGVALLVRSPMQREGPRRAFLLQLAAVVIGVGCGSGAALVAVVLMIPVALLLRWSSSADPS